MERPGVGVGVFVIHDGKFLMQRRRNAHGEGTWSLPGGHLEFGESIENCARREVLEELGVTIRRPRVVTLTNDVFVHEGRHYITIFVVSDLDAGEPHICEPDKSEQFGWFVWDDMPKPLFLPLQNLLRQEFNPFL
ncbi:MAG TPA: NUDIX hydrolase [Candidatus Methylomirabilis sp.]|nr:NUDIX hydrolase [Candidatus Methylomirabilis sp.]